MASQLAGRALLAMLAAVVAVVLASTRPMDAAAQSANTCTAACQAAYAHCYRSSGSNRKVCEGQLQQCLAKCIPSR